MWDIFPCNIVHTVIQRAHNGALFIPGHTNKELNYCRHTDESSVNHQRSSSLFIVLMWISNEDINKNEYKVWKHIMNYALNKSIYFYAAAK